MKKKLNGRLALTIVVLFGFGSDGSAQPKKIKVAFVTNNTADFWTFAYAGCRKAEKDLGVDVTFRWAAMPNAETQAMIIDALLGLKVQAIAVSVIDPQNQTEYLKAVGQQIPLLTHDNDAPASGRQCYIGTDNYAAGRAVGKLVKQVLPNGGTVAILVGTMAALNAQQRFQGVVDELAGMQMASGPDYGKYKLLNSGAKHGVFTDDVDLNKSKQNAGDVLVKHNGDDLCLVGLWAYNPPAIYQAVKAVGRQGKVKIVGFDELEDTLWGIGKGHIHGTVVQQPFEFGYQSVKLMAALAKGDRTGLPKNGILYIPHRVITQENVEPFQKQLKEMRDAVK